MTTRRMMSIPLLGLLLLFSLNLLELPAMMHEIYAQPIPLSPPPRNNKQSPSSAILVIFNHVNDTLGGKVRSSDFSMVVANLNVTKGPTHRITQTLDFINGSETGTILQMMPGSFFVTQNS